MKKAMNITVLCFLVFLGMITSRKSINKSNFTGHLNIEAIDKPDFEDVQSGYHSTRQIYRKG